MLAIHYHDNLGIPTKGRLPGMGVGKIFLLHQKSFGKESSKVLKVNPRKKKVIMLILKDRFLYKPC